MFSCIEVGDEVVYRWTLSFASSAAVYSGLGNLVAQMSDPVCLHVYLSCSCESNFLLFTMN